MTEEDAKQRWCPFARFTLDYGGGIATGNRWDRGDGSATGSMAQAACLCIASACMAWRTGVKSKFKDARTGQLHDVDLTGHGEWVTVDGYCGLAGAPS